MKILYRLLILLILVSITSCIPTQTSNKFLYKKRNPKISLIKEQSIWRIKIIRFNKVKFIGLLQIYINNNKLIAQLYDPSGLILEKIEIDKQHTNTYIYYSLIKKTRLTYIMRKTLFTLIQINRKRFNISKVHNFLIEKSFLFIPIKKIRIEFLKKEICKITINWPLLFLKVELYPMELANQ